MKHLLSVACLSFAIAVCGLTSTLAKDQPTSAERLRSELETALKTKDTNAVMSFVNWEGVSDEVKGMMIAGEFAVMLKSNVTSVKLSPLPANFQSVRTNEENGLCQTYNATVVGLIDVEYTPKGGSWQLPYGKKGDVFYIAGTLLERNPGKRLAVNVLAGPNSDSLTYTGSWVYVKDGKDIKVDISDKTNRFKRCWGDYIKSCTIQRTFFNSTAGFDNWFYFQISEGGTNIFESQEITNEAPIVYEKK